MTAESFSAEPGISEADEPRLSPPAHWSGAPVAAPPPLPTRPVTWPQATETGPAGAPSDRAPRQTPDIDLGATQEWAGPTAPPVPATPPSVATPASAAASEAFASPGAAVPTGEPPVPAAARVAAPAEPAPAAPAAMPPVAMPPAAMPPAEAAPVEAAPVPTAPVEAAPVQTAPVEAAPVPTAPVEAAPLAPAPFEAAPVEMAPHPDADAEAVERLLRIAVVSRPLEDIADLVTRLEQTPDGAPTAASILRLAAVARPVDDVTRLAELLGPPEHPAGRMDEAIRHAAEERPIPEVTRLVQLLSSPQNDPRSGTEAVHAAATSRSVEDLLHLINSLSDNGSGGAPVVDFTPPAPEAEPFPGPAGPERPASDAAAEEASRPRIRRTGATPQTWMRRVAGVLMLLCAAAHFPMDWSQGSLFNISATLGVSAICAAAGIALCISRSVSVAVASILVAGALAVGHLLDDRVGSGTLAQVLHPAGVPAALPSLASVVAALAALLVVAMTVAGPRTPDGDRGSEPRD